MSVSRETKWPGVSRETFERLALFVDLLAKWNTRINLVSRRDIADIWDRHIYDSLQLAAYFTSSVTNVIDLGSGAGFPGLVLAIATGASFTMVEADARKAAFLREALRATNTSAVVLHSRIEDLRLPAAPVITARALAPLPRLMELSFPLLAKDGTLLLLKGASVEAEIAEARRTWTMRIARHISRTGGGVILQITEVERA